MYSFKKTLCLFIIFLIIPVLSGCSNNDENEESGDNRTWQTIFEDNFNRTTIGSDWTLIEGDGSTYYMDGESMRMNQIDTIYEDGPGFLYNGNITDNIFRISAKIFTQIITGDVETGFALKYINSDNQYATVIVGNGLFIGRIQNGIIAIIGSKTMDNPISSNQECIMESLYDNGNITFTLKDSDNNIIDSVSANDPNPLSGEKISFMGEIDDQDDEYLYLDDFKIEVYK